jgi:hypothetical protein
MKTGLKSSFATAGVVAVALTVFPGARSVAQEATPPTREFIQATAEGTSTQLGRMISVNIILDEYSTLEDQKALLEAFEQKGSLSRLEQDEGERADCEHRDVGLRHQLHPGISDAGRQPENPAGHRSTHYVR